MPDTKAPTMNSLDIYLVSVTIMGVVSNKRPNKLDRFRLHYEWTGDLTLITQLTKRQKIRAKEQLQKAWRSSHGAVMLLLTLVATGKFTKIIGERQAVADALCTQRI